MSDGLGKDLYSQDKVQIQFQYIKRSCVQGFSVENLILVLVFLDDAYNLVSKTKNV